jgi:hypothetical protein
MLANKKKTEKIMPTRESTKVEQKENKKVRWRNNIKAIKRKHAVGDQKA